MIIGSRALLETSPYLTALPFAALIALVIVGIVVFLIVRSYSMKHKPVDYPLDQFTRLELQQSFDKFAGKEVTSRELPKEQNRGGKR